MNHVLAVEAAKACGTNSHIFSGCGFPAPSIEDFYFTPLFTIGSFKVDKSILIVFLSVVIVLTFFWLAFRKPRLVPRGAQNVAELGIFFVRDQILRPQLGVRGDKWLPFLTSLFFFIWINNIFGILPILYFPSMSKYGYPLALTIMVWCIYMFLGMKIQGAFGYFRNMAVPSGAPWWILPLLVPIELFSNILVRPFTLSVRLFANMLAGHVLLLVFTLATWYLLTASYALVFSAASFIVVILITALEVLIQALQAFIFATLTATYIAGAYETAH
ncbi:MAG TPA: F0F1 ATP synthase subunit A [Streptosporangiaceae bacterium]|nr:F0F1 ATP synthase subunit A [Streptosporangiaceae bacterium]